MAAWQESLNQHTLDLASSKVVALAEALRSASCTLHKLDLDYNDVREDGVRALAEALRSEACTLHTLNLNIDGMSDDRLGAGACGSAP